MVGPVSITIAEPIDLPAILSLASRCVAHMRSCGIDQWDEVYPDEPTFRDDIERDSLFLTRGEKILVGCAVLNTVQEAEYLAVPWRFAEGPVGVVHRLMIDPNCQGQGIARTFMSFLESLAFDQGMKSIRLDAFSQNQKAIRLYESLGYFRAGLVRFRKGEFLCFEKRCEPGS